MNQVNQGPSDSDCIHEIMKELNVDLNVHIEATPQPSYEEETVKDISNSETRSERSPDTIQTIVKETMIDTVQQKQDTPKTITKINQP